MHTPVGQDRFFQERLLECTLICMSGPKAFLGYRAAGRVSISLLEAVKGSRAQRVNRGYLGVMQGVCEDHVPICICEAILTLTTSSSG